MTFNDPPPIQETQPEVFILESLSFDDEETRCEGRILADILRLCGTKPRYYYFRTEKELEQLADVYRRSGYRYLHLSCHGDRHQIHLGLNSITFARFGEIFEGKLRNRRLFVSACEVGTDQLVEEVSTRNRGMYSIMAPLDSIAFPHAMAFWASFYTRIFDVSRSFTKNPTITDTVRLLNPLFRTRFRWAYHETVGDTWNSEEI